MKIKAVKMSMSQIWKNGKVIPITWLKVSYPEKTDSLEEGVKIAVSGVSKGKGFQGVVKRHGFGGGPKSHGQKDRLRAPGSLGATAPQRVTPGRKMAGRMGGEKVTIKNMIVESVKKEENLFALRGAIPGPRNGIVHISF